MRSDHRWQKVRLGDIVSFEYGSPLSEEIRSGNGYPVIGSSGVTGYHSRPLVAGPCIVIGRKGTVGSITWSFGPAWPIDTTYWVKPEAHVELRWLYWRIQLLGMQRLDSSTGVPGLNRFDAYRLPIYLPSLPEQRRIAKILDTLDDQIMELDSYIDKVKNAACGLAQDLLRRRYSDRQACEVKLGEVGTWLSGGTPSASDPRYWGGEIPWISSASLKHFHISGSDRRITSLGVAHGTQVVPAGAILFVVRGMSLKKEFRIGVAQREVAFGQDCKAVIPDPGIYPLFLAHAVSVRSDDILRMVEEAGHGTGRLPTQRIAELVLQVPPLHEQQRTAEILERAYTEVREETRKLDKLQLLKQGLMDDLLFGRVRVPAGEEDAVLDRAERSLASP